MHCNLATQRWRSMGTRTLAYLDQAATLRLEFGFNSAGGRCGEGYRVDLIPTAPPLGSSG
jgi:hypothetical protein